MNTTLTNPTAKSALESKLGFQIATESGTAWPHSGAAGNCISSNEKQKRLAKLSAATGLPVIAGMYVRFATA